ncbi:hypothetical protein BGX27_008874 [Mortierella sp. AM989]|nr:hypothetical protein BGX27_008874 [Mortierella sp. AM989]
MTSNNPIRLPEIRQYIVVYLNLPDIISCLLVNKSWYGYFIPLVWENVVVPYRHPVKSRCGPTPECLYRHRKFVFSLRLETLNPIMFVFSFPNLQALYYRMDPTPFINLNPLLTELELVDYCNGASENWACWKPILELTNLRKLILGPNTVPADSVDDFWRVCANLETLSVLRVNVAKSTVFENMTFPRMRDLYLDAMLYFTEASPIDLIKKCPRLKSLRCNFTPNDIARHTSVRARPNPLELGLNGNLKDDDAALILQGMNQAINLDLCGSGFGPLAFGALGSHFNSLVVLDLLRCESLTSIMARDILCSCPRLLSFQADYIKANDIADGGPWICLSLRRLTLYIEFLKTERDLQPLVFERLSQLVHLQILCTGAFIIQSGNTYGLDIRLSQGLHFLESLKELECLNVGTTVQSIGEAEVNWIAVNWRSLKFFYGEKNTIDRDTDMHIRKLLREHGINVC